METNFGPYAAYLQALLPVVGGMIQFRRADSSKPEADTFGLAFAATLGVYLLCFDWSHLPQGVAAVQQAVLTGAVWFGTVGLPAVLGGTFIASKYASATGGKGLVPITNSK